MTDFIASFESFLVKRNPNVCLTCWGEGKLQAMTRRNGKLTVGLPITGLKHEIDCPNCKGLGKIKEVNGNLQNHQSTRHVWHSAGCAL